MTTIQFAMVEELASLIKDNLYCKHLVLSIEEALISFLQNDSRPEVVLELQPMSPYQRLLLHRLADIYGFAHESVGEGEERHLLLERCPETAIPSILVSDILWEFDGYQSPTAANLILRRKDSPDCTRLCSSMLGGFCGCGCSSFHLSASDWAFLLSSIVVFSLLTCS